jgi:hypothetical protein
MVQYEGACNTNTTVDMRTLAGRLEAGTVAAAELKLAAKLVTALVDRLPPRVDVWKHGRRHLVSDKRYSRRC